MLTSGVSPSCQFGSQGPALCNFCLGSCSIRSHLPRYRAISLCIFTMGPPQPSPPQGQSDICVGSSHKRFASQRETETLGVSSLKGILQVIELHLILDFPCLLVFEYLLQPPMSRSAHRGHQLPPLAVLTVRVVVFVSA